MANEYDRAGRNYRPRSAVPGNGPLSLLPSLRWRPVGAFGNLLCLKG